MLRVFHQMSADLAFKQFHWFYNLDFYFVVVRKKMCLYAKEFPVSTFTFDKPIAANRLLASILIDLLSAM